ncbi:NAD/NADP octopine/nopaline dehydrogenase family protein [Alcaligenaceae bacterium C4P045]|nr:NAD/NADP octopine/nopaline dehydrogenase family protein [Alcaligenaceae bacterium C4P045]
MAQHDYRVAILGAGPIGCATAAFLSQQGIKAGMWSPTARRLQPHEHPDRAQFECVGAVNGTVVVDRIVGLDALVDYTHIFVCLPGSLYQRVLEDAAQYWRTGQTVIVSGALSLVPLWIQNEARSRGAAITAVGWGTTLTTAHFLADGRLHLNAMRQRIDMACLAVSADATGATSTDAYADCQAFFGNRFVLVDSLLASTLANINPIAHAAEVIPNLTRMDRGEPWQLFAHFTGVVARMADALDRERLALARRLGFELPTLAQHYHRSYHVPQGPLNEMAQAIENLGAGPLGPDRLEHRYVLEDVPFGLVFQERLAQMCGVDSPMLSSCITLLEAIYERSFRRENFLIAALLPAQTPRELDGSPSAGMSVGEMSVDKSSADKMSMEEMSLEQMSTDDISANGISADHISADDILADEMPLSETSLRDKPSDEIAPYELSIHNLAQRAAPIRSAPLDALLASCRSARAAS